jgi:hypothetical protein
MRDRLVAVVWRDPRVDQANTYTREEIAVRGLPYFTTFGLLARDDEEVVAVAAEQGEDGAFRGVTYILRPLVKEIIPICEWPKRPRGARPPRPKNKTPAATPANVPGLGDVDRID